MQLEFLIEGCKRGDLKCQRYLYDNYYTKLFGIVYSIIKFREESEEVINDVFLKIYSSIGQFEFNGSFEGWLKKIAYRTACSAYKSKKRRVQYGELQEVGGSYIESYAILQLDAKTLMGKLPTYLQNIVNLYASGYNHKEIAAYKNINEGTSKWHLHHARKRMRNMAV